MDIVGRDMRTRAIATDASILSKVEKVEDIVQFTKYTFSPPNPRGIKHSWQRNENMGNLRGCQNSVQARVDQKVEESVHTL